MALNIDDVTRGHLRSAGYNDEYANAMERLAKNPNDYQAAQIVMNFGGGAQAVNGAQAPVDSVTRSAAPGQQQTAAQAPAAGPVTSGPPGPYTVPPTIRGKQEPGMVTVSPDTQVRAADGSTTSVGRIVAALQSESLSNDRKAALRKKYGIQRVDGNDGNPQYAVPTGNLSPEMQQVVASQRGATVSTAGGQTTAASTGAPVQLNAIDRAGNAVLRNTGLATAGVVAGGLAIGAASGAMRSLTGIDIGSLGSIGALGGAATAASAVGLDGIAFNLRRAMRSVAASYQDDQFIGMLHSGLNIEALIYYFMAYASDKYDKKLREKMEEWTRAEQQQDKMERNKNLANMASGLLSLIPGVGTALGTVATVAADTMNRYSSALNGSSKSSTVLMQEVQILVQQWKLVQDLTSNLSKDLHEMAMTAVRNLR